MELLDKWADRIYSETDVGRSIAVSVAGIVGLIAYAATVDGIIGGFAFVIVFPIIRLIVASKHDRLKKASDRHRKREEADATFQSLSDEEKRVVHAFADQSGCVMTWGQFNRSELPSAAIETLMQRDLVTTSVTADGCTETFVLGIDVFDACQRHRGRTTPIHGPADSNEVTTNPETEPRVGIDL